MMGLGADPRSVGVVGGGEVRMFEHRSQPLLPLPLWLWRLARFAALAGAMIGFGLGIGTLGYHYAAGFAWLDAALNAAMILTGMGPVDRLETAPAKLFAIAYSLFSGILFLGSAGVLVVPWIHRLLHIVHAEFEDDDK